MTHPAFSSTPASQRIPCRPRPAVALDTARLDKLTQTHLERIAVGAGGLRKLRRRLPPLSPQQRDDPRRKLRQVRIVTVAGRPGQPPRVVGFVATSQRRRIFVNSARIAEMNSADRGCAGRWPM